MTTPTGPITVKWEEPPGQGPGQPRRYEKALEQLRKSPGKWGKLDGVTGTAASNKAGEFNKGTYPGIQPGEFEATTRTIGTERLLYVRYIGHLPNNGEDDDTKETED